MRAAAYKSRFRVFGEVRVMLGLGRLLASALLTMLGKDTDEVD